MRYYLAACALALLVLTGCTNEYKKNENKAEQSTKFSTYSYELVRLEKQSFIMMGRGSGTDTYRIHYKNDVGEIAHRDVGDGQVVYKIDVPHGQSRSVEFFYEVEKRPIGYVPSRIDLYKVILHIRSEEEIL